ncbi:hypothetical protein ACP70R_005280 [Stipagrostis hirtigluma subsp. patula]
MAGKAASAALLLAVVSLAVFAIMASGKDCPRDALMWHACAYALGGLVDLKSPTPHEPCCELLQGLADVVDAAACLCAAIGTSLIPPVNFTLILNNCGKREFKRKAV